MKQKRRQDRACGRAIGRCTCRSILLVTADWSRGQWLVQTCGAIRTGRAAPCRRAYINSLCIQGEHKRTLHFQNDTENKCGLLRTSHLHQSTEKLSKFCTHLAETRYVLRESHGRCRDKNPARPKLCAECPL
jgi:hypothetical protein